MNTPFFDLREIWRPNEAYTNHRIPGMLVTDKGTLIIYCEARRGGSDWADMDIIMQRSTDYGKTFDKPYTLARGTEEHHTVNNPVMMQDARGRIHFLYCEDYTVSGGRALRRYSDDDGISWSEPIDVSAFTNPGYHNAFAFGPGHGIVTKDGTLLVPVWMVPKHFEAPEKSHAPSVISTFYSKDNGETWSLGDFLNTTEDVVCPNETVAALTSCGGVYMNIRHKGSCRAKAYSKSGFSDWNDYSLDYSLPDPQCFGSVAAYDAKEHPYTLIFANCADQENRTRVTVRASTDDGITYPISKLIDEKRGGYVEVATDSRAGLIYVLYEDKFGITDHLARFNYEWLFDTQ